MASFLKKINSLPVPLSIKHYYAFGGTTDALKDNKLDSGQSWDVLRESHPDFSIATQREEWLKACELEVRKDGQDNGLKKRAEDIVVLLRRLKFSSLFSVGAGGAGLEYQIKKLMPDLNIVCSEYSQKNVDMLKGVFLECNSIIRFDITSVQWPKLPTDRGLFMIYRVDASFTDKEWRVIFENAHRSGVEHLLYIPTTFLTVLSFFIRLKRRLLWIVRGQRYSFAGYLRTQTSFQGFWKDLYDEELMTFGGLKGFLLKRK